MLRVCAACQAPHARQRDCITKTLYCGIACQRADYDSGAVAVRRWLRQRRASAAALIAAGDDNDKKRPLSDAEQEEEQQKKEQKKEEQEKEELPNVVFSKLNRDTIVSIYRWLRSDEMTEMSLFNKKLFSMSRTQEFVSSFRWRVNDDNRAEFIQVATREGWLQYIVAIGTDSYAVIAQLTRQCPALVDIEYRPVFTAQNSIVNFTQLLLAPFTVHTLTIDLQHDDNFALGAVWAIVVKMQIEAPFPQLHHLRIKANEEFFYEFPSQHITAAMFPYLSTFTVKFHDIPVSFPYGSIAQLPSALEVLSISMLGDDEDPQLDSISLLPPTIRELELGFYTFQTLDLFNENMTNMLPNLEKLTLSGTECPYPHVLDHLPKNLKHLRLDENIFLTIMWFDNRLDAMPRLEFLPVGLETLEILDRNWEHPVYNLPQGLQKLVLFQPGGRSSQWDHSLANLPPNLKHFEIYSTALTSTLETLPTTLEYFGFHITHPGQIVDLTRWPRIREVHLTTTAGALEPQIIGINSATHLHTLTINEKRFSF